MKSITRRVIAAAGTLAMAGGVMAATALPAYAGTAGPRAPAAHARRGPGHDSPARSCVRPAGRGGRAARSPAR
jgi:hypothetical protein